MTGTKGGKELVCLDGGGLNNYRGGIFGNGPRGVVAFCPHKTVAFAYSVLMLRTVFRQTNWSDSSHLANGHGYIRWAFRGDCGAGRLGSEIRWNPGRIHGSCCARSEILSHTLFIRGHSPFRLDQKRALSRPLAG